MDNKKNILFVIISNGIGGAESTLINLIKRLDVDRFNITLLSNNELLNKISIDKINYQSIGYYFINNKIKSLKSFIFKILRKILGNHAYKFYFLFFDREILKKIEKICSEKKIDIIHSHLRLANYFTSKIKENNIKKIFSIHGSHDLDNYNNLSPRNYSINKKYIRGIYNSADIIISATNYFFDLLKNNGLKSNIKKIVIDNGIDFSNIDLYKKDKIYDGFMQIVFLGGDRDVKGWNIILDAVKILVENLKINNFVINVLRDVSTESKFMKKVNDFKLEKYIVFHGYINNPNHLKYIANSDLFILPSKSEGVANTLLEAVGLKKPVLATNVGGTPDIIKHMKNGLLIDYNAEELAMGIKFFIDNPNYLVKFSLENSITSNRFDWDKVIKQYEKIFLEG